LRGYVIGLVSLAVACTTAMPPPARTPAATASESPVEPPLELERRIEQSLLPAVVVEGEPPGEPITLAARMIASKVSGLGIAVFDEAGVLWAKGYGVTDAETGSPVTQHTLFQAGSISKSVNALAVLLAAEGGTVDLDVPINDLASSWKLPDNDFTRASPVTLRRLLSHTAGTTVHGFPGYPSGAPLPTVQQVLDGLPPANTPPVRVDLLPGAQFRYSGGGITLSQLILVDRLAKPYPTLLDERVLGPLGMVDSTYQQPLPPERLKQAASGHDPDGTVIPSRRHVYPEMAAAGLWTTPTDLATFFRELALARAGHSTRISQRVAREMTTAVDADPKVGLGVFLYERNGARYFGHDGVDAGFNAIAVASLDAVHGVVMMANSANGLRLFPEIERTVFAALGWAGADMPVASVTLSSTERAAWLGAFAIESDIPFTIHLQGERLLMTRALAEPIELIFVSATRAVTRRADIRYTLRDAGIDLERARGPIGRASRIPNPETRPLLELAAGRNEKAVQIWRERAARDPHAIDASLGLCLGYGNELLASGENAGALTLLGACADLFPERPAIHAELGAAYAALGDLAAAIDAYEAALYKLDAATWLPPPLAQRMRDSMQQRLQELRERQAALTPPHRAAP
jgi:CubicO group peptidase (beta-lactamase class C family)